MKKILSFTIVLAFLLTLMSCEEENTGDKPYTEEKITVADTEAYVEERTEDDSEADTDEKIIVSETEAYIEEKTENDSEPDAQEKITVADTKPYIEETTEKADIIQTEELPETKKNSDNAEWKQFIKEYNEWVDDYIAILEKYKQNPMDMSILSDYTKMVSDLADWSAKSDEVADELENSPEASMEYAAELAKIAAKLAEAAY